MLLSFFNLFSHPDFTVGFGISPNQLLYGRSRAFTAGREFHPAPKIFYIYYFPYIYMIVNFFIKVKHYRPSFRSKISKYISNFEEIITKLTLHSLFKYASIFVEVHIMSNTFCSQYYQRSTLCPYHLNR